MRISMLVYMVAIKAAYRLGHTAGSTDGYCLGHWAGYKTGFADGHKPCR